MKNIPNGGYCPYRNKEISLGECIDLASEVGEGIKKKLIISIMEDLNLSIYDMEKTCNECENFPFEEKF